MGFAPSVPLPSLGSGILLRNKATRSKRCSKRLVAISKIVKLFLHVAKDNRWHSKLF